MIMVPVIVAVSPKGERQQDQDGTRDDSLQQGHDHDQVSSIDEHKPALSA
jgi:hypothetical protein